MVRVTHAKTLVYIVNCSLNIMHYGKRKTSSRILGARRGEVVNAFIHPHTEQRYRPNYTNIPVWNVWNDTRAREDK